MTQYIKKLPAVFQTVTEKKFFDATFDQVFSKKDSDLLAGYIGQRIPGQYNPSTISTYQSPQKTEHGGNSKLQHSHAMLTAQNQISSSMMIY